MTPDEFFAGSRLGREVHAAVSGVLDRCGAYDVRVTRSQVAFRRRRGFAYLWLPGQYLAKPDAEVVLSVTLDHHIADDRFKEVAHPSPTLWQHHIELHDAADIDGQVAGWLREAFTAAA